MDGSSSGQWNLQTLGLEAVPKQLPLCFRLSCSLEGDILHPGPLPIGIQCQAAQSANVLVITNDGVTVLSTQLFNQFT